MTYALLSVSDKTNILTVARKLVEKGVQLLSTGGTFKAIQEAGIPVQTVDSYTGFPEMLDGRVKTLHPKIHGGLLGLRDSAEHQATMKEHEIAAIDYVIVNLYPFKETISQNDVTLQDAIENIDIGGPSMLRSAAKNYQSVTVVTDPADYDTLISQLDQDGQTSFAFRQYLAGKVFQLTSHYDTLIADYLKDFNAGEQDFPVNEWAHKTMTFIDKESLRYGENGHQKAAFYKTLNPAANSIAAAKQLHGKQLSYNNLKDADAALKIAQEFDEPVAVAVKHMNPCGVAVGATIEEAFDRCFQADNVSIYGGIVVVNRPVTLALANELAKIFLEIIIAPSFEADALARLEKKKNLRLLTVSFDEKVAPYQEFISITGGLLVQDADLSDELPREEITALPEQWTVATTRQPDQAQLDAMNFGMKVVKHVKSNAIIINNEYMTLGIGAGQMNRVGSARIAIKQAEEKDSALKGAYVMSSDAFLPMDDTATLAHEHGIKAIVQPGGSIHDEDSVVVCDANDMTMVMTGNRHFRH
ncbi:bifunctional phosphoribosylaminoimidazolecarboxamide formyltransferase/IMP cyclohydrolase [Aerococcus sp. 1KP-2016]|uniref:bifunctional phosphoribosylaminoimidazolecarboxamide formyltransferase/IMP cyclohydrolase n=1 Tax=Aerococcus sp. 1KP-2016 TaxID=1981982 RepID=UPI000B98EBB7|nr:bifunctional phosphoribosylaminoimidazolecarboxamide formyltransferase/IMP cyclohydrolase [Aerococcus sp. 1KP-2016]OYQ68240.1 bifunctional phosphoribosylaminoimidazolecarboxamide formyltransferase/IMP cyclohydrolase [Aerococcus sp. 1KP-2016]